jgi:hypothetical protein
MFSSDDWLDALAAHCPLLQVLSYEKGNPDSTDALVRVLQACPVIELMDISSETDDLNGSTSDRHIAAILQHAHNLKALRCPGHSAHVSDAAMLEIAARLPRMLHMCQQRMHPSWPWRRPAATWSHSTCQAPGSKCHKRHSSR